MTFVECLIADTQERIRKSDKLKRMTSREGFALNRGETLGKHDRGKRITFGEGQLIDDCHRRRQVHTLQQRTPLECADGDVSYTIVNTDSSPPRGRTADKFAEILRVENTVLGRIVTVVFVDLDLLQFFT